MLNIRTYKDGDELGFQKLDQLVEEHPWNRRNLDNWRWKFKGNNPAGKPIMIYAENDGEIIGHFAALPMNYWINGKKIVGSHSAAMMIDPAWQNKGLIKFVADRLINELIDIKIPFTYGYPNDNAYDLHVKLLGYEEVAMQRLFYKSLKSDNESQSSINNLSWRKINKFSKEVNVLWDKAKTDYTAIVIRNDEFLNWRYIDRPDVPYHAYGAYNGDDLEGYCILKTYKEQNILRGHFVDLFTMKDNNNCSSFLIQNGISFFKEKHVNEITLWMQGSPFLENILKQNGFIISGISGGGWPGSSRPMICRFNFNKDKYKPILNDENWYFTMGDTLEIY